MNKPSLSPQQIEWINAYGPYNHAVWQGAGVTVSQEERLEGRGEMIQQRFRDCLHRHFSEEEIRTMTAADIGCYDGWFIHRLSDLPFARMVGIEPREKNIQKGRKIREILGIESRVEFRQGDVDSLGGEMYDVVIAIGLLHHLESLPHAVRKLTSVCRRMLFLECVCLSPEHITPALTREMELKDIVYNFKPRICGITGHKYESAYYDGSAASLGVVSVPSLESLRMLLDINGFGEIDLLVDASSYAEKILRRKGRTANAVCLAAFPRPENHDASLEAKWIEDYEAGLLETRLDPALVQSLYERYCQEKKGGTGWLGRWIRLYVDGAPRWRNWALRRIEKTVRDPIAFEIIKNIQFNPFEKIALEWAKCLYGDERYAEAAAVLQSVTERLNADWRACYRGFFLLMRIAQRLGDGEGAARYRELCLTANPRYPVERLQDY